MTAPRNGTTPHAATEKEVPRTPSGPALVSLDSALFQDVQVSLEAKLGEVTMTIAELLALKAGSVLQLERGLNDLVEIRLNQSVVARGEIVAVDDNFGVRIVEIAPR
jgi:flagellar motor switch protein FliN/FliY